MDQHVTTPAAGLRQQHEVETRLAAMMDRNLDAEAELRGLLHQLESLPKQTRGPATDGIGALVRKVAALAGGHEESLDSASPETTLSHVSSKLGQLYGQVSNADAAPTASQIAAVAVVEKDDSDVMTRWKAIKSTDLPALNSKLSGAGPTIIELKAEPEPATESENEE